MDINELCHQLYIFNDSELFYKEQFEAREAGKIKDFIKRQNMDEIKKKNLLIPEVKESMPLEFIDSYFFDTSDKDSIVAQKHNRYAPPFKHTHTFFEIAYVYDGTCIQTINNESINMKKGDLCIIPPGVEHSILAKDDGIIINVMLRRGTLHRMFYSFLNSSNILSSFFLNNIYTKRSNDYIMFHSGNDEAIRSSFVWMLNESYDKQEYYYQCMTNTLLLDFYLLIRNYSNTVQVPQMVDRNDEQRYAIVQYIQDNYKDITLSKVADNFHYSNEYTSHLIKNLLGMTYSEIVKKVRIERSQDLLANTTLTVANIAEATGYDTTEHYIRQFKSYTGMTPSAFRKQEATSRNI